MAVDDRVVPPCVPGPREPSARCDLPFGLGWQPLSSPPGVRLGVVVGDVHDRVVEAPLDAAARALGTTPAGAGPVLPPRHLVSLHRRLGWYEDSRAGNETFD